MIQFGEFIFDAKQARLLTLNGQSDVTLEPKLFELLALFIAKPNEILTRDDLLNHLWAGSLVTDNAINKLIGNLRKALGDNAKSPRYIQTVPKRGYRFVCDVSLYQPTQNQNVLSNSTLPSVIASHTDRRLFVSASVVLFVVIIVILWSTIWPKNEASLRAAMPLTRVPGIEQSHYMHANNRQLFFIKQNDDRSQSQLWFKDTESLLTQRVKLDTSISEIISVIDTNTADNAKIFYLDKTQSQCGVYQANVSIAPNKSAFSKQTEQLFDCSDKRIKDLDYHHQHKVIYYTAQPQNFWPNQIYSFDIKTKTHQILPQPEPKGWGHHHIDISPNGEKLLIMSTDNDHKTQLLALNLTTHKTEVGIKFNRPAYEAIWHHDSSKLYYFSDANTQQIVQSDFNGNNIERVVDSNEALSYRIKRLPNNNLLFATSLNAVNLRWLGGVKESALYNSTVADFAPALLHFNNHYLFASKRSGRMQIYRVNPDSQMVEPVSNFNANYSINSMAISTDDQQLALGVNNQVYYLPLDLLNGETLTSLSHSFLLHESEHPFIAMDWHSDRQLGLTIVKNGIPELLLLDLSKEGKSKRSERWTYSLHDSENPHLNYLIEHNSNLIYRVDTNLALHETQLTNTQFTLPNEFYHAKIDNGIVYFVTTEESGEYLNIRPLDNTQPVNKLRLHQFKSFDVSKGKILLSDMASREGDIYRTL